MKQIFMKNALTITMCFLAMILTSGCKEYAAENWAQILYTLEAFLPLLVFVGAPLIITIIIVIIVSLFKYTIKLGASFIPPEEGS